MVGKNNLIKQMGNARFLTIRSCFTLENYRLVCKVMRLKEDKSFEERKFSRIEENFIGTYWYLGTMLHRLDGPAVEYENGGGNGMLKDSSIGWMVRLGKNMGTSNGILRGKDTERMDLLSNIAMGIKCGMLMEGFIERMDPRLKL